VIVTAVGVDPGVQWTGCAAVDRGRLVHSARLRGVAGAGKDWQLLARTARLLASSVSAYVLEHQPSTVGVETMVDQGPVRQAWRWRHTTAACCQAIYDKAVEDGWDELLVWQRADRVLSERGQGLGVLKYLLEQGRAGAQVGAPGPLDEHQASAATHATWAEATWRRQLAGS
jgi:hypothetical protein